MSMRMLFVESGRNEDRAAALEKMIAVLPKTKGIEVSRARRSHDAFAHIRDHPCDMVLIGPSAANDATISGGGNLIHRLRAAGNNIPILYIGEDYYLLETGADSWHRETEDLTPGLLDARIQALMRLCEATRH